MNLPDPSPPFFPPPFPGNGEAVGFWPQFPISNDQPGFPSHVEYHPSFKKLRIFKDLQPNSFPNPPMNPRMPPNAPPITRPTSSIFFKTRICAKFKLGQCPYGETCNFAHGFEDLRKPPPNWQELVSGREEDRPNVNWDDDQRIISRLRLCKKFYNGEECPYGERCNFLHEDPPRFREDSRRSRESSAISIGTTGDPIRQGSGSDQLEGNALVNSGSDANRVNSKPVFWKTRFCNKWETTGQCPFGEKCHFAHGQAERETCCYTYSHVEAYLGNSTSPSVHLVSLKSHTKFQSRRHLPCGIEDSPKDLQNSFGQNEVVSGNPGTIPPRPFLGPPEDAFLFKTGIGATTKQQVQIKKCLLKWKGPEKISRIYADWIDDMPLIHSSPSKVES